MIDEKKIPQRIYIKDYQLAECEIEGVADARINAVPYKCVSGKICEYINVDNLWHDASEEPQVAKQILVQWLNEGEVDYEVDWAYPGVDWRIYIKKENIIKWCYLDNLH